MSAPDVGSYPRMVIIITVLVPYTESSLIWGRQEVGDLNLFIPSFLTYSELFRGTRFRCLLFCNNTAIAPDVKEVVMPVE